MLGGREDLSHYPDLVDAVRDRLQASGKPWIIENVPGAPLRDPITLCGAMFGLRSYRHRLFEDAKVGAGDTAVQGDMLLPANCNLGDI